MCTSIYFRDSNTEISTISGLAEHLAVAPTELVFNEWYVPFKPSEKYGYKICTCPLDLPASVAKFGYTAVPDEDGDPMCFIADKFSQ